MKCITAALVIVVGGICSARLDAQVKPSPGSRCMAKARARATDVFKKGASREAARLQLEIAAAACLDPTLTPAAANLVGAVNANRARFAGNLIAGKLTLAGYRAALHDQRDKLTRLLRDPDQQRELSEGDADGDLVSDRRDRCPKTPDGTPTDSLGCPRPVSPRPEDQRDERRLRQTLASARFLYNKSCDGAPSPGIPAPLVWGRGPQTKLGTHGFNLAVAKVSGQPAGCETFYEIQFRFIDPNPGNPALPPSKIMTVVFSAAEDLLTDATRAVFPLPVGPPLSPARTEVREAMLREYFRVSWRVRAVNGSNLTSKWSPFVTQGPASGGVGG